MKKLSEKRKQELLLKKEENEKMKQLFLQIWDERQDKYGNCYCFETGARMPRNTYRTITACYDHVLEKQENAYPQYKFTKKNIVIILPSVHAQKGMKIEFTPKIMEYKKYLLNLHEEGKLED